MLGQYLGPMLCICPLYSGESGSPRRSISCTSVLVEHIQQRSCGSGLWLVTYEKRWKSFSPSCSGSTEKSTVRASSRTGVPVFIRSYRMPWRAIDSVRCSAGGSAQRPPGTFRRPTCSSPFRNVPAVIITALARSVTSQMVCTPRTSPSSTSSSSAWSCHMLRLGVFSSMRRHSRLNFMRSHCERGLHTAGPFERLSIRNCMAVLSVTIPICPPSASISRTICPLAIPPMAGLQLICAILFMSIVTRQVLQPRRAAALAASQPACPAPTTTTSNSNSVIAGI